MPPTIVAPERETPGMSASIWHRPMPSARGTGVLLRVVHDGRGRGALDDEHHDAAGDERGRDDRRALVQHALDEAGQERAGDERGNGRHDDRQREVARVRPRRQPARRRRGSSPGTAT